MSKRLDDLTPGERQLIDILGAVAVMELEKAQVIMADSEPGEDYTPYDYQRINHHLMMSMMARVTVLTVLIHPGEIEAGGRHKPVREPTTQGK